MYHLFYQSGTPQRQSAAGGVSAAEDVYTGRQELNPAVTASERQPEPPEAAPAAPVPARQLGLTDSLAYHLDLAESLGWSPMASSAQEPAPLARAAVLPRPDEFEQDAVKFARPTQVEPFGGQDPTLAFAAPRAS